MNDIDKRILKVLQSEGRLSWVKLAERVNLSPSACQRHVEAMQASGMIKRFTLNIDPVKVGLNIHAFIHVKVERQRVETASAMRATIQTYPEVQALYKISGPFDYLVDIVVVDIKALSDFIDNKLLALDGVSDASSSIVLDNLPVAFDIL